MDIERIIQLSEHLGMTRVMLAREIGVNAATLWRWERAGVKPTPLAAKRLEQVQQRLERRAAQGHSEATE